MLKLTLFKKKPAKLKPAIAAAPTQRVYKTVYPYVLLRHSCVWLKLVPYQESGPMTTWELSLAQVQQLIDHAFDSFREEYPGDLPYLPDMMPGNVIMDLQDTLRRLLQEKPEI